MIVFDKREHHPDLCWVLCGVWGPLCKSRLHFSNLTQIYFTMTCQLTHLPHFDRPLHMEKPSYTNSCGECLQHSIIQRSGMVILFQHSRVQKHCFIARYVQALTVIILLLMRSL